MSSNEDECNEGDSLSTQGLKKRRIQRACDICRRKKSMFNRLCHSELLPYHSISSSMSVPFHQLYASATFIVIGDGVHMPGNRCSNCVSYSLECTYVEASKVMVCFDVAVTQWLITLRRNEGHQKGECIVYNTITSSKIGGFPIKLRWKPRESGRKVG